MTNVEFLQDFLDEAKSHLEVIEGGIISLENQSQDMDLINKIFRAVHSIKGTAGFFELKNIVDLAHGIENNFDELRENKKSLSDEGIDVLLKSFDLLKDLIENVQASDDADIGDLLNKLHKLLESEEMEGGKELEDKKNDLSENVNDEVNQDLNKEMIQEKIEETNTETSKELKEATKKGDNEYVENFKNDQNPATKAEPDSKTSQKRAPQKNDDSIRVNVSLLNSILNLASELVLGRNQLLRVSENYKKEVPSLEGVLQNIDHITTELQERVMQTRMQPLGTIFNKFPRVVRDLSKKLEKDVELTIMGADVELDKSIIESLADPLTHIIRNSLDHGIEDTKKRKDAGKELKGKLILNAYHEGGYVIIDIKDDGGGVSVERIKEKVLSMQLATKTELENMQDNEIIQFLFHAGLSTAEKVTDVSGRGVGMDVVKNNIEKLGGNIEIQSVLGKGTTVRLLLPLTLAIISAIIVQVENEKFALPQINLQEIVRIKHNDMSRKIEYVNKSEVLRLRGKLLPIISLKNVMGLEVKESEKQRDVSKILVIKIGSRRFGLLVDDIHGSEEILVKPIPLFVKNLKSYSGVTILGDGKVAMILDPDGIMNKANLSNFDENAQDEGITKEFKEFEKQNMLVFKCSGQELLALDIAMVKRIEEMHTDDIEEISGKEFFKYLGKSIRIIRPENVIPNFKQKKVEGKAYIIIPRMTAQPIGILISGVVDTVNMHVDFVNTDKPPEGILGTIIVHEKLVSVLNVFYIFESVIDNYVKAGEEIVKRDKKILFVEDTPFFQRIVKEFLESAGFVVELAENGKKGYEFLQQEYFDAVVTDIQMPVMDGIEFAKKIRNDENFAKIPVIGLTSMTGERNKKIGIESGFDSYQYKLDKDLLLSALDKFLGGI